MNKSRAREYTDRNLFNDLMKKKMDNSATTAKSTNEEIIDQLVIKVNALEKREIKLPDYTPNFEDLKIWLANHLPA